MRLAAGLVVLAIATPAHADRLGDRAAAWLEAVRAGRLDAVVDEARLPLAVTARGICVGGGTLDHPRLTGIAGRRSLRRLLAAVRACIPARARLQRYSDDSAIAIEWGPESVTDLVLTFDADGRLTSIEEQFAYGGP